MKKFIIRNDDVNYDTKIDDLRKFCELCDEFGYHIIQAITPLGECRKARVFMTNDEIKVASPRTLEENPEVIKYLKSRKDSIGVHGLWHTHKPTIVEIDTADAFLRSLDFYPTYFVPPFNEGYYPGNGLETCCLSEPHDNLEKYLDEGSPPGPIAYLHSWRFFDKNYYTFDKLKKCFQRLKN